MPRKFFRPKIGRHNHQNTLQQHNQLYLCILSNTYWLFQLNRTFMEQDPNSFVWSIFYTR